MNRLALLSLALLALLPRPAAAATGVAIVDFTYLDSSGEPADQTAAHQRRLAALMAALRQDFAASSSLRLVTLPCGACADTTPDDLRHAAMAAGATVLVVGGIHKMSTLIQWAKVTAIDLASDRVLRDRLYTFRGDDDEAWRRAESFIFGDIGIAVSGSDEKGHK